MSEQTTTNLRLASRVLIVDDSPDLVQWLEIDLQIRGFRTDSSLDGETCLAKLDTESFNAIILDVMMPGETDFIDFLRRHPRYDRSVIPWAETILYVYSHGRQVFLRELLDAGFIPELAGIPVEKRHLAMIGDAVEKALLSRKFGPLYIHFDGFTVCRMIKSLTEFEVFPHIFFFTAGSSLDRAKDEAKSIESGGEGYFLKSEYDHYLLAALGRMR